jgi:hypothetical protein
MADAQLLKVGEPFPASQPSAGYSTFTIDQTTDQLEVVFNVPFAITITRLGFRYSLRTGTPPSHKISLQGVDASGNPDGTIKGGGSPASGTFTPPASAAWDNTWQWVNLDNAYTCARGERFAMVIAYNSGTVDGSNNSQFNISGDYWFPSANHFPYVISNNAGVRARGQRTPCWGYGSAGTAYGWPSQNKVARSINTGSTPDEYGLRFIHDSGFGSSYQIVGARVGVQTAAGADFKIILYDGTTVLQDVTVDSDYNGAATHLATWFFDEATLSTLNFGSTYRLAIQPTTLNNVVAYGFSVAANADLAAYAGGLEFYGSHRTDAGAWTDVNTERPFIVPILADWTVAASGGIKVHPGMTGGMRG